MARLLARAALALAIAVLGASCERSTPASAHASADAGERPAARAPGRHPRSEIPDKALRVLRQIRETGRAPPGYVGGRRYANDGRDDGQQLDTTDARGRPIRYREWDVNPWREGVNRGPERLVTGSDGRSYYTRDHYRTFVEIQ
jgi:guanyl-specific ribonuclease Sa